MTEGSTVGKGASPLSSAGGNGDFLEMAALLVKNGAGVNTRSTKGMPPLIAAASGCHGKVTNFLLARGANPNVLTETGFPALYMAARSDYCAASIEALLNHGADPNARNPYGQTALHQAASQGAPKIMDILLGHKAEANAVSNDGYTPLYNAVQLGGIRKGGIDVLGVLVKNGANLNAQNGPYGLTPLQAAISKEDIEIVNLLISYGADVNATNKAGATPLQTARKSKAMIKLLEEHGAR